MMRSLRLLIMLVFALTVTSVVLTQRAHADGCSDAYTACLDGLGSKDCGGCVNCGLAYEACEGTNPWDPQCYEFEWCQISGYCGGGACPY